MNIYPYTYIYNGKLRTLLWSSSEKDNSDIFLCSNDGNLYKAKGINDAKSKFESLGFEINWNDGGLVDFDKFWSIVKRLAFSSKTEDCQVVLDGWNFIEDMVRTYSLHSLREKLDDLNTNIAYKKIFYVADIEAFKLVSEEFIPQWSENELSKLESDLLYVWSEIGKKIDW